MRNPFFWRCIEKYGWDGIEHIILCQGLSLEDAKKKEAELVTQYRSNERAYGYNIRAGGDGSFSEESRKKMSLSRIGNTNGIGRKPSSDTRQAISHSLKKYYSSRPGTFTGRHHSAETITKLKDRVFSEDTHLRMRKPHPTIAGENNPSARPVQRYSQDGTLEKTYAYATAAAKDVSGDLSAIIKCCKGKLKQHKGFIWRYQEQI